MASLSDLVEAIAEAEGIDRASVNLSLQEAFSKGDVHIDLKFRTSDLSAALNIAPLPESDVITPAMASCATPCVATGELTWDMTCDNPCIAIPIPAW